MWMRVILRGKERGSSREMSLHHRLCPTGPRKAALLPGETLPVCHFPAGSAEQQSRVRGWSPRLPVPRGGVRLGEKPGAAGVGVQYGYG